MKRVTKNERQYLKIIKRMSGEQRLGASFELYELARKLAVAGARNQFPSLSKKALEKKIQARISK